VLAGEGRAGGDEVGGRALEDDPAAVVAGAGAEVDYLFRDAQAGNDNNCFARRLD
jgi:hypothetical protein